MPTTDEILLAVSAVHPARRAGRVLARLPGRSPGLAAEARAAGIRLLSDFCVKTTGRTSDRDPFILNPHPQFEPGEGQMLMIQHNRGGKYSPDGQLERLVGPEGATLYVPSVPEGRRTERAVGTPHTTACTGHEAWLGTTGEMLLSVSASGEFRPEKGNLLAVRAGQPPRVVARGYRFNHVGASRCGRVFSADDWEPPYKIVVGSAQEKRAAVKEAKAALNALAQLLD